MVVLVQKYGGSSLSTLDKVRAVAQRVATEHLAGRPTVVVVSARGDTTDDLLRAAHNIGELPESPATARELDHLLVTGECASAATLAMALLCLDVPAVSLSGRQAGIKVTGRHGAGVVDAIDTTRIVRLLEAGNVVVVGGFHGVNEAGDMITLGRGGSDTTAVALAAALGARECEIYTDVDGVYTADPRIVPTARKVPNIGPAVMAEMAFAGAGVLHSRAVELAAMRKVAVHVRSSTGADLGTVVADDLETGNPVVAVTHDLDVARVLIRGNGDLAAKILDVLARNSVPVDLIARSGPHEDEFRMGFTVRRSDVVEVRLALERAAEDGGVRIDEDVAKVSLVGMGLLSRPTYVARMLAALSAADIPTSWVFTSQVRASVTVPRDRVAAAVALLHQEFGLAEERAA
ncbi:aspartate kinase [Actinophytocola sp. KF-1]